MKTNLSKRLSAATRILFGRGGGGGVKSQLLADLIGGIGDSGKPVSEAQAMSVPAFNLAVCLIADTIANLPLRLRRRGERDVSVVESHDFYDVFRQPCGEDRPGFTGPMLLRSVLQQTLIHGNAYVEQVRVDGGRKLRLLRPIDCRRVDIEVEGERAIYRVGPRLAGGSYVGVDTRKLSPPDIIHIRGRYVDGEGWEGLSTLATLRSTLNIALAQNRHARESLIGGNMSGFLSAGDGELSDESMQEISDVVKSPDWDNKIPVFADALRWTPMRGTNTEAQFDESRRAQVIEIGRAFNVPPHLLMSVQGMNNWGSGLTQMAQAFVRYTLSPWAERIEDAFTAALLTEAERRDGMFFEFDFARLLRGSPNERADFYQKGIASGWLSPAEARAQEGLSYREGADDLKPVADVEMPVGAPPAGEREPNQPQDAPAD